MRNPSNRTSIRSPRSSQRARRTEQPTVMPFRGFENHDLWRTCFCFHVRTVTIFIGVWYLMIYILVLSFFSAMMIYGTQPHSKDVIVPKMDSMTPKSSLEDFHPYLESGGNFGDATNESRYPTDSRKENSQTVLVMMCNISITLLMVYGAVRGKPSYLTPFFVLRVFEFCVYCLTIVGRLSMLHNVNNVIENLPYMPYKKAILRLDNHLLSSFAFAIIVISISIQGYIILVIWSCYKYLMLRNTVIRGVISYRHDDSINVMGAQQNLLLDLPDYDTAVSDPRYAKKPAASSETGEAASERPNDASVQIPQTAGPNLPPSYSVAIGEPSSETLKPEVMTDNVNQQDLETCVVVAGGADAAKSLEGVPPTSHSNENVTNELTKPDIRSIP